MSGITATQDVEPAQAEELDIQQYLRGGVEGIVRDAARATLRNPRESAFMARFALASRRASDRRDQLEAAGEHVPAFLIASITNACNLHCAGCFSRANHPAADAEPAEQLSGRRWGQIFEEARDLGVSFILLAGGEPLVRRDVVERAAQVEDVLFPVITNGTFLDEEYLELLDRHRNVVPVMSVEGGRELTDARRGPGVHDRLVANMAELKRRGILFGASVTVTTENLDEVTGRPFLDDLAARGCKAVFFIEFVPVNKLVEPLAPGDAERAVLMERVDQARRDRPDTVYLAFPGDEKRSSGCLAAGRGFFHINARGGAEPCPFSPFSDTTLADVPLREALRSPLFLNLRASGGLAEDHRGGCTLYGQPDRVAALAGAGASVGAVACAG